MRRSEWTTKIDIVDQLIEIEDYISERLNVQENITMTKANRAYTANDKLAKILTGFTIEELREGEI